MKIIYVANDGKQFDEEWKCKEHEFKVTHSHLKTIEFYDKNRKRLTDPMEEETYNNCVKIIIHSIEESNDLIEMADYMGYSLYYDIIDIGTWIFDDKEGTFVKYVNPAFNQELSDKYVKNLKQYVTESEHEYADEELMDLLVELGYIDVVEEYKTVPKWYS